MLSSHDEAVFKLNGFGFVVTHVNLNMCVLPMLMLHVVQPTSWLEKILFVIGSSTGWAVVHDLEKPFLRSKSFGQKCNSLPLSAQYFRVITTTHYIIIGNLVVHLYNEEWGGFRLSGDFSLSGNFDGPPVLWSSLETRAFVNCAHRFGFLHQDG